MATMVKQRSGFRTIVSEPAKSRLKRKECPACGKPKSEWNRRTDWTCCSKECSDKYYSSSLIFTSWADLRLKVFRRDHYKCVICGHKDYSDKLIADHIIPIALDGDEWDMDNIQTLCEECNKIKTKHDISEIAKVRNLEKKLSNGQKQLEIYV